MPKLTDPRTAPGWLRTPDWYPERIDPAARRILFCRMSRESYGLSPFLDHRIVKAGPDVVSLDIDDIPAQQISAANPAPCFVFHCAFTCSTLLSRYLESASKCLVLREPDSLYQLATLLRFRGRPPLPQLAANDWNIAYEFVAKLLARSDVPGAPTIIKPSDGCNNLMTHLLRTFPESRAVFLYSGLERFLVAVLKHEERHEWARIRARELTLDLMNAGIQPTVDPRMLDAGKTAALIWVLHVKNAQSLSAAYSPTRVTTLDDQALLARPPAMVTAILGHFGVKSAAADVEAALASETAKRHSKANELAYSADAREREYLAARARLNSEVMEAVDWVRRDWGDELFDSPFLPAG